MTLRGSVASFPLETIVQLIAATAKTGQLEIRSGDESGTLGFAEGRLVSAVSGDDAGDPALGAVFALSDGEFEFLPWTEEPAANVSGDLNQVLDRAVVQRDRIVADRQLISDDRMRFALSDRAASQGEVRLSADQWRTLLAVNGERDLPAIAGQLKLGRLGTLAVLADLVRSGIVEAIAPAPEPPPPAPAPEPPPVPPVPDQGVPAAAATSDAPAERPRSWTAPAETESRSWDAPADTASRSWDAPADTASRSWDAPADTASRSWDAPAAAERRGWEAPAAAEPAPWDAPSGTEPRAWDAPSAEARSWEAPAEAEPRGWEAPADAANPWTGVAPPGDVAGEPAAGTAPAGEAPAAPDERRDESDIDARLAALSGAFGDTAPATWPAAEPPPPARPEPAAAPAPRPLFPPPTPAATPAVAPAAPVTEEPKKKGGLFSGLFKKNDAPARGGAAATAAPPAGARAPRLAALANGLLDEYANGEYGKGQIEGRMANLLMRVDEQADPIDRPLPVASDRIDVDALERSGASDAQVAPYLALLVSQIYEDAERAFGKDKARRGYKSVQQRVIGDSPLGPDLRLPRV